MISNQFLKKSIFQCDLEAISAQASVFHPSASVREEDSCIESAVFGASLLLNDEILILPPVHFWYLGHHTYLRNTGALCVLG